jgi:hypothetical protein
VINWRTPTKATADRYVQADRSNNGEAVESKTAAAYVAALRDGISILISFSRFQLIQTLARALAFGSRLSTGQATAGSLT